MYMIWKQMLDQDILDSPVFNLQIFLNTLLCIISLGAKKELSYILHFKVIIPIVGPKMGQICFFIPITKG